MTQHDTATSRTFLKVTLQESCNTEKDLGVWVPSGLTYEKQVPEQCAKDKKILGYVHLASRGIQTRRTLYFVSIVRCHLGYENQVLKP